MIGHVILKTGYYSGYSIEDVSTSIIKDLILKMVGHIWKGLNAFKFAPNGDDLMLSKRLIAVVI